MAQHADLVTTCVRSGRVAGSTSQMISNPRSTIPATLRRVARGCLRRAVGWGTAAVRASATPQHPGSAYPGVFPSAPSIHADPGTSGEGPAPDRSRKTTTLAEVVPGRDLAHSATGVYSHAASATGAVRAHPRCSRAVPTAVTICSAVADDLKMVRTSTPLHPARPPALSGHAADQPRGSSANRRSVILVGQLKRQARAHGGPSRPGSPPEWPDGDRAKAVSPPATRGLSTCDHHRAPPASP